MNLCKCGWPAISEHVEQCLIRENEDWLAWTGAPFVYALWAVFGVLEPLYVRDVLGGSDAMFALLQTVFGVGPCAADTTLAVPLRVKLVAVVPETALEKVTRIRASSASRMAVSMVGATN